MRDEGAVIVGELLLGRRATGLDPATRRLRLDSGDALPYGKLLVATGGAEACPAVAITIVDSETGEMVFP